MKGISRGSAAVQILIGMTEITFFAVCGQNDDRVGPPTLMTCIVIIMIFYVNMTHIVSIKTTKKLLGHQSYVQRDRAGSKNHNLRKKLQFFSHDYLILYGPKIQVLHFCPWMRHVTLLK